jgi:hypothetical protein
LKTTENWYSHIPKSVNKYGDVIILCNEEVQTDREVLVNRPGIIVKTRKTTWLLIDVSIP